MVELMDVTYDRNADAMYWNVRKGRVAKTQMIDHQTLLDLDVKGNVIGVELLRVSKRMEKADLKKIPFRDITNTRRMTVTDVHWTLPKSI